MTGQQGQWVDLPKQLYVTDAICNCDFCGQRISRQYLAVSEQGRAFRFCRENCVRLWREYWLPRYGAQLGIKPPSAAK
jgi:ribosomal protein L24E